MAESFQQGLESFRGLGFGVYMNPEPCRFRIAPLSDNSLEQGELILAGAIHNLTAIFVVIVHVAVTRTSTVCEILVPKPKHRQNVHVSTYYGDPSQSYHCLTVAGV